METKDLSSNSDTRKILLIGDISRAFLDAEAVRKLPCEVHANMPDAIEAAAKNSFAAIVVVMSGMSAKLSSALKRLRQTNSGAKIVLLVQMYEEPIAMQLVASQKSEVRNQKSETRSLSSVIGTGSQNGVPASLADDYLICPIHFSYLVSRISWLVARDPSLVKPEATYDIRHTTYDIRERQLEKLATEDDLTGLKNRRYIWEFTRQIIERAKGGNGRVTLLVFDIDNLKHYNDVYGHLAGDEVLRQAAVLMRRCCRGHDVVGRIGGDEFAVVFWDEPRAAGSRQRTEPRSILRSSAAAKDETLVRGKADTPAERRSAAADHPKEAIFIAKRFRKELEKTELHLLDPEGKGVLTISGGLASCPRDGSTIQELFQQADEALLEAKRSGKNRIYLVGKPQNDIADI